MSKKEKSPFRWPFNKHRMGRIAAADKLAIESREVVTAVTSGYKGDIEHGGEIWMAARRCARKFERAGSLYVNAGMNAAAAVAFGGAATCWDFAGEKSHADVCRNAAGECDTYYV